MARLLGDFRVFAAKMPEKKKAAFSGGNYPYVCARVKARRAFLLSKDVYPKLLQMEIPEISRFIGESQYRKEITELGLKYSGLELTEIALNRNLANVSHQLLGFCKGDLKDMMSAYLRRWDVWNIKTLLRGKYYGADNEEIMKTRVPAGMYGEDYWKNILQNSSSMDDAIDNLRGNEYHSSLVKLKERHGTNLMEYENWLEIEFYRLLLKSIRPASRPNQLFLNFIRMEIDLVNLKTLFMAKFEGVEGSMVKGMLVWGGEISRKDIEMLADTQDFDHFLAELSKFPFYELIKDEAGRIKERGTLNRVIRTLEKDYLQKAEKFSRLYPLSVLPVLNYVVRKKIEVDNLRIIVRGKDSGLDDETLREMLVV